MRSPRRWTFSEPLAASASRPLLRSSAVPAFALPALVLAGTLVLVLLSPWRIGHDCALYLQCAQFLLEGKRPFVDFIEINPPLIYYLNVVPVLLAKLLHVAVIPCFSVCVVLLGAWSTWSVGRVLEAHPRWQGASLAAATVWALFTAVLVPSGDFGQREHLIALLYLPYLLARSLELDGDAEAAPRTGFPALGIAAGLALAIKPQYLPVGALLEVFWFLRRGRRPALPREAVACALVLAAYAAHFFFLPAAAREAFFARWMPLVAGRYSVYDAPFAKLVGPATVPALLLALAGLASIRRNAGAALGALGIFVLGSFAVFFWQHKGWPYQQLPIVAGAALLLTLGAHRLADRLRGQRLSALPRVGLTVLPMLLGAWWLLAMVPRTLPFVDRHPVVESGITDAVRRFTRPGEPVVFLSTSVSNAYPLLLQMNRRPGSRYMWGFPIAMVASEGRVLAAQNSPRMREYLVKHQGWLDAQERQFIAELRADLDASRPPLVFVQDKVGAQACPPDFNVLRYMERTGVVGDLEKWSVLAAHGERFQMFVSKRRLAELGLVGGMSPQGPPARRSRAAKAATSPRSPGRPS